MKTTRLPIASRALLGVLRSIVLGVVCCGAIPVLAAGANGSVQGDQLDPEVRTALRNLSQGKEVEASVARLRVAVEQTPDAGALARDVGLLLLRENMAPTAQAFLEIARARLPEDGIAAQMLGLAHVVQYHYADAYEHLAAAERLLPAGPPRPTLQQHLSMVLIGLQRMEESETRALRAIAEADAHNAKLPVGQEPVDRLDLELNLVNVYQKWQRFDAALAVLDALPTAKLAPKAQARAWLSRAQLLDGRDGTNASRPDDSAAAQAAFAQAVVLAPDSVPALYESALFHLRRNRQDAARPLLEKAVAVEPGHEGALYNLARVLLRQGVAERGKEIMARYREIQARRMASEVQMADLRNRLLEKAGRTGGGGK